MNMTFQDLQQMFEKAETGEQFAEICRLEAELIAANDREREIEDNSQFGVGA